MSPSCQLGIEIVEWVTEDLVQVMQSNPILSNGLKNAKCMAALQLMQKSPAEAKLRFGSDHEVNTFVTEFGRVMGQHFTALGEKEHKAPSQALAPSHRPAISEVTMAPNGSAGLGPLSQAALQRNR